MNVIPARLQDLTKRVEKTPALIIALFSGLTALWSVYRLLWLVYAGFALSTFGLSPISLIISFVVWTAVAVAAGPGTRGSAVAVSAGSPGHAAVRAAASTSAQSAKRPAAGNRSSPPPVLTCAYCSGCSPSTAL